MASFCYRRQFFGLKRKEVNGFAPSPSVVWPCVARAVTSGIWVRGESVIHAQGCSMVD